MAKRDEITLYLMRGDKAHWGFTITHEIDDTVLNFAAATQVLFSIKRRPADKKPFVTIEVEEEGASDWAAGYTEVTLTNAETSLIDGDVYYDLQIILDGEPITPCWGKIVTDLDMSAP